MLGDFHAALPRRLFELRRDQRRQRPMRRRVGCAVRRTESGNRNARRLRRYNLVQCRPGLRWSIGSRHAKWAGVVRARVADCRARATCFPGVGDRCTLQRWGLERPVSWWLDRKLLVEPSVKVESSVPPTPVPAPIPAPVVEAISIHKQEEEAANNKREAEEAAAASVARLREQLLGYRDTAHSGRRHRRWGVLRRRRPPS